MKGRFLVLAAVAGALLAGAWIAQPARTQSNKKQVLVVTYAAGFKHSSRPVTAATVRFLGEYTKAWEVAGVADTKEELASWVPSRLKDVDLVVFASTTGDLGLSTEAKKGFYDWIKAGGNFVGVHSATDTYHGDPDYLNLIRGEFLTHGPQVKVTVYNQDPSHPATKAVPASFEIFDEIYEFKNWERGKVHVLLSMKKHPNPKENGKEGDYAVAWTNRLGEGRMFYTSLGHREDVYLNTIYLNHLAGGIKWALGLEPGDDTPGNPIR